MAMLVPALAGSATYVRKRLRIKSALRSSFWLMTLLFSLMVLTGANGCFVPPARRHRLPVGSPGHFLEIPVRFPVLVQINWSYVR